MSLGVRKHTDDAANFESLQCCPISGRELKIALGADGFGVISR
jgi:hypothetical protein